MTFKINFIHRIKLYNSMSYERYFPAKKHRGNSHLDKTVVIKLYKGGK